MCKGVSDGIDRGRKETKQPTKERTQYMQIELKKLKICKWMSQETNCYACEVWIDGKLAGWAENDGHGGPDSFNTQKGFALGDLGSVLNEYATKHLPIRKYSWGEVKPDAETLMGDLIQKADERKKFDSDIKKKILYTSKKKDGSWGVFELAFKRKLKDGSTKIITIEEGVAKLTACGFITSESIVLNIMRHDLAFDLYRQLVFVSKPLPEEVK